MDKMQVIEVVERKAKFLIKESKLILAQLEMLKNDDDFNKYDVISQISNLNVDCETVGKKMQDLIDNL